MELFSLLELQFEQVPDPVLTLLVDEVLALPEAAARVLSIDRLTLRHGHRVAVYLNCGV